MDVRAYAVAMRFAGQWEPPPALYREVAKWAAELYAGHVLGLAENRLKFWHARARIQRGPQTLAEYKATAPGTVEQLKPTKRIRFESPTESGDAVVERVDDERWRFGEGKGTRIDWDRAMTLSEVLKLVDGWLTWQERKTTERLRQYGMQKGVPRNLMVETLLLQKECLKYTDDARRRANRVNATVKVDVSGWKYLTPKEIAAAPERLRDANYERISLSMKFRAEGADFSGRWEPFYRRITLIAPAGSESAVPTVAVFRSRLNTLLGTVWHEVQHAGQDLLQVMRKLNEIGGLPSRDIRVPDATPSGMPQHPRPGPKKRKTERLPHELRDVEFFTNLGNDTRDLRALLLATPVRDRRDLFERFVGDVPEERDTTSDRLWSLKMNAPAKWQAAVRLLAKSVDDLL